MLTVLATMLLGELFDQFGNLQNKSKLKTTTTMHTQLCKQPLVLWPITGAGLCFPAVLQSQGHWWLQQSVLSGGELAPCSDFFSD